jgi:hypothetical protein
LRRVGQGTGKECRKDSDSGKETGIFLFLWSEAGILENREKRRQNHLTFPNRLVL